MLFWLRNMSSEGKDILKADLKAARKDLEAARQNTKDALKTTAIQDKCINSLTAELEEANTAQDCEQAKVEQLKASNQQLLGATGQDAANAGVARPNQSTII